MKPDDIPEDVRLLAGQVVVMLPPMYSAHETGRAIDRIARAILAERRHGMEMAEKAFSTMDEEAYGAIVKLKSALATIRDKTKEPSISAFASLILSEVEQ